MNVELLTEQIPVHCVKVGRAMVVGVAPVFVRVVASMMLFCVRVMVTVERPVTVKGCPDAVMVFVLHAGPWQAAMVVRTGVTTVVVAVTEDVTVAGIHVAAS